MNRENGSKQRRQFTAEDKATILRRHLADKIPVSDLCDEYNIQPSLFYLWQRQALEHLSAALQDGRTLRGQSQAASADRARLAALEARLAKKDAIIAEVSEEYLALKKKLGERWKSDGYPQIFATRSSISCGASVTAPSCPCAGCSRAWISPPRSSIAGRRATVL